MEENNDEENDEAELSLFVRIYSSVLSFIGLYKKYLVLAMLGSVVYFFMSQDYSHVLEDAVTAKPVSGSYWDFAYAKDLISESKEMLRDAVKDFDNGRFDDALDTYRGVDAQLGAYARKFKAEIYPDGGAETILASYEALLGPLQARIIESTQAQYSQLRKGGAATEVYDTLHADFHPILSADEQLQLRNAFKEMDTARAQLALRQVRIVINSNDAHYANLIKNQLSEAWNSEYSFDLSFGSPLGPQEERATWRSYELVCEHDVDEYSWTIKDETNLKQVMLSSAEIPVGLKVHLKVREDSDPNYVTSWDSLRLLNIKETAPDTLDVSGNSLLAIARVRKIEEEYSKRIAEKVRKHLAVPDFEITLPRKRGSDVTTDEGPHPDPTELRWLGLKSREKFVSQSRQWLNDPDYEQSAEIIRICLEQNLTQTADLVVAELPELDRSEVEGLGAYLETKLWWGDYQVAFELMKRKYYPTSIKIQEALIKNYGEAVVREHLLSVLSQADNSSYQTLARLVAKQCPSSDLPILKSYLPMIEGSVASELFSEIYSRDEDLATSWMLAELTEMPKRVQYAMISRHQLRTWGQDSLPEMLDLYKTVYDQPDVVQTEGGWDRSIQGLILRQLKPLLRQPEIFEFAKSLDLSRAPEAQQIEIALEFLKYDKRERDIAYFSDCFALLERYAEMESQLHRAFAESGDAAKQAPPEIVKRLLSSIIYSDVEGILPLKRKALHFFAQRTDDPYLTKLFLSLIYRHEWDWTQDAMVQFLEGACRLEECSEQAYQCIFRQPEAVQEHYAGIIQEGLELAISSDEKTKAQKRLSESVIRSMPLERLLHSAEDVATDWTTIAEGIEIRLSRPKIAVMPPSAREIFVRCEVRNSGSRKRSFFPMARFYLKDSNQADLKCLRYEVQSEAFDVRILQPGESTSWWQHGRVESAGKFHVTAILDAYEGQTFSPSEPLPLSIIEAPQLEVSGETYELKVSRELRRQFDAFTTLVANTDYSKMKLSPLDLKESVLVGNRLYSGFVFSATEAERDLVWSFTHTPRFGDLHWSIISEKSRALRFDMFESVDVVADKDSVAEVDDAVVYQTLPRRLLEPGERYLIYFYRHTGLPAPKAVSLNLLDQSLKDKDLFKPIHRQLNESNSIALY